MTIETAPTDTQPTIPAAPVDSTAAPVSEAPAETPASTAPAEAPVAVVEQPAPSAPEVPAAEEFQAVAADETYGLVTEYDEEGSTPPVASRPCYAGPEPRPGRDIPGRA